MKKVFARRLHPDFQPGLQSDSFLIRREILAAISEWAPQVTGSLLDFGCGQMPYRDLFNVSEYVGVDYPSPGHSHANESIDVVYDGKQLPFEDNRFDAFLATEVMEHVFNPDEALSELHRVLKPGGMGFITCPFSWRLHEEPADYARYTPFALAHLVQRAGFEVKVSEQRASAVEVIFQYIILYADAAFFGARWRSKFVNRAVRAFCVIANSGAIVASRILPEWKGLYLTNVLVLTKP